MAYLDFDIEIGLEQGLGSGRDYPVKVRSHAGEARIIMHFPFDEQTLEKRLEALQQALLRSGDPTHRAPSLQERAVQDFGQELFNALITDVVSRNYAVSKEIARRQNAGLRLRLHIQAPELAALPWEFLFDSHEGRYVCRNTPIVRYLDLPLSISPLGVTLPLRILVMIASPIDQPPLNVERENHFMKEALRELLDNRTVELGFVEGQTWRDLQKKMRHGPWHIFHFIGHGKEGVIALTDDNGRTRRTTAEELDGLLTGHSSLRLVLLNACEGARSAQHDIFSSTASTLAQNGIPAVIAMQYKVTDTAAIEFTRTFYTVLAEMRIGIDGAVTEARKAIHMGVTNTLEWGTPVLYMRTSDSILFEPSSSPPPISKPSSPSVSEPLPNPVPTGAGVSILSGTASPPPPISKPSSPSVSEPLPNPVPTSAGVSILSGTASPPPPIPRRKVVLIFLAVAVILSASIIYLFIHQPVTSVVCTPVATATSSLPSTITIASDGEPIGYSDGSYAFDTERPDGSCKALAAIKLMAGDMSGAEALWTSAHQQDTRDAEALIYKEDQEVKTSHHPYITLVVATILIGQNVTVGRDDLQGAYVAQKAHNDCVRQSGQNVTVGRDDCVRQYGGMLVRLLVASSSTGSNSSDEAANASRVAEQIKQAAQEDKTFVGVIGWPFSTSSFSAINILGPAHILLISPTSSSNSLTSVSPYFLRVAPPDSNQGSGGAQYAEQKLHAARVALFFDPDNTYSKSLKESFFDQFVTKDHKTIVPLTYSGGKPETLLQHVQEVLNAKPDLIYIAGYSPDAQTLLNDPRLFGFKLMGGDALYQLRDKQGDSYPPGARGRTYFTAFADPDEWDYLCQHGQTKGCSKPLFFCDYANAFDPHPQCPSPNGIYGINRADADVTLTYDAMQAFLAGIALIGKQHVTSDDLRNALLQIAGSNAVQGVSGQISFGTGDANPINKAFVVLHVDAQSYTQIDSVQGCFLVGKCS